MDAKKYTSTDLDGKFVFKSVSYDSYVIEVTYVGYKAGEKRLRVTDKKDSYIVTFKLDEDVQMLGEVSVQGRATRAEQKGDSLFYNAEAFKVMQGSSAEDLLAKMPGIVVEGGTIQAQGEDVKKILVDGKEFFEGDVNLAIKNLPSDVIASIEVFDKKSEQAEFTGIDDGEEIKTINIITNGGYRQGTFGEVSAGYGTEDRYKVNGNINFFNDDRGFPYWVCRIMSTSRTSLRKTLPESCHRLPKVVAVEDVAVAAEVVAAVPEEVEIPLILW